MQEEGYDEDEDEEEEEGEDNEKAKREEEYLDDEDDDEEEDEEEEEEEERYIPLQNIAQPMPYRLDGMPDIPKLQEMFVHRISWVLDALATLYPWSLFR